MKKLGTKDTRLESASTSPNEETRDIAHLARSADKTVQPPATRKKSPKKPGDQPPSGRHNYMEEVPEPEPDEAPGTHGLEKRPQPHEPSPYRASDVAEEDEEAFLYSADSKKIPADIDYLKKLILLLQSPHIRMRMGTALMLAGIAYYAREQGDNRQELLEVFKEAVPLLLINLDHEDATVRGNNANALGELGPIASPAIPKLKALLRDPEPIAHNCAYDALHYLGMSVSESDKIAPFAPVIETKAPLATPVFKSARTEAERIHTENLKYTTAIPEKTILCHIITDSILPDGQKDILKILEQDMRDESYREKVVSFSNANPAEFIKEVGALMARQRELYKDYTIKFDVACPSTKLVEEILNSNLEAKALAFEPCKEPAQVEGIMLALRALHTGDLNSLRAAFEFLVGRKLSEEELLITDIDEFVKRITFILPKAGALNYDDILRLNQVIRKNIKTAA